MRALILIPILATAACQSEPGETRPAMPHVDVEGQPMYTVLPMDAIPSIDEPVFVSASEADAFLQPEEPVLGVVGANGSARAYSAWHLEGHEIVNDVLDGRPIAATW